jgi:hypothetical protein
MHHNKLTPGQKDIVRTLKEFFYERELLYETVANSGAKEVGGKFIPVSKGGGGSLIFRSKN